MAEPLEAYTPFNNDCFEGHLCSVRYSLTNGHCDTLTHSPPSVIESFHTFILWAYLYDITVSHFGNHNGEFCALKALIALNIPTRVSEGEVDNQSLVPNHGCCHLSCTGQYPPTIRVRIL